MQYTPGVALRDAIVGHLGGSSVSCPSARYDARYDTQYGARYIYYTTEHHTVQSSYLLENPLSQGMSAPAEAAAATGGGRAKQKRKATPPGEAKTGKKVEACHKHEERSESGHA